MKKFLSPLFLLLGIAAVQADDVTIYSPDSLMQVTVRENSGSPVYSIIYNGKQMLEESPLGLKTNVADFTQGLTLKALPATLIEDCYSLKNIKTSHAHYVANEVKMTLSSGRRRIGVEFRVGNNDVAFRYTIPVWGDTRACVVADEATGFNLPDKTTTFLTPQSDAMIGWKRTKPSYEEVYKADAPMSARSQYGHGYTFPALFHVGDDGWVLISETGVDSRYCASRLSDASAEGLYTIEYPMPEENNGNGTSAPGIALPGVTPWRTITIGETLKPIVETTIPWDLVSPLYETTHDYKYGRGTWSWIMWQDNSINYDDQVRYIDLAAAMGYEYVLIDNWWDNNIGRTRMADLIKYAHSKKVDVFLWYSSSGYWNDIEQGPVHHMDNPIIRKREMKWMESLGVKGIKVDFFGGDKQETMRLYEAILSDADDHGLMCIFHGCTLPRGWERMYPNYVGSEAVLASENLIFTQESCDNEAFNACLHPFIRNTVGCMEFGGVLLNKRNNRNNDGGTIRRTTDIFQLATGILFQNPIQNFALAPNNLTDAPALCIDFMKQIPTTWDETRFIDGYPGKYCVLARRHGDTWYVAGINAGTDPLKLKLTLPMFEKGQEVTLYDDNAKTLAPQQKVVKVKKNSQITVTIAPQGGIILQK